MVEQDCVFTQLCSQPLIVGRLIGRAELRIGVLTGDNLTVYAEDEALILSQFRCLSPSPVGIFAPCDSSVLVVFTHHIENLRVMTCRVKFRVHLYTSLV